jgi:hypothetical protein
MRNAAQAKEQNEAKALETVQLADWRNYASDDVADNTEEVATALKMAKAAKAADQFRAAEAAAAELTDKNNMAYAINAARNEEAGNDYKAEQAYDLTQQAYKLDAQQLAAARATAAARRVEEENRLALENARYVARQVADVNEIRAADSAAAAQAERLANSANTMDEREYAQANADRSANEAAAAQQFKVMNSRSMTADAYDANVARALTNEEAAVAEKHTMQDMATWANQEKLEGDNTLADAQKYAAGDALDAANFREYENDASQINSLDIGEAGAATNADTVATEGAYADADAADWQGVATAAQRIDLGNVADGVDLANAANAINKVDATDLGDAALVGTAIRRGFPAGYGLGDLP